MIVLIVYDSSFQLYNSCCGFKVMKYLIMWIMNYLSFYYLHAHNNQQPSAIRTDNTNKHVQNKTISMKERS